MRPAAPETHRAPVTTVLVSVLVASVASIVVLLTDFDEAAREPVRVGPPGYREIAWADLVPAGWDPVKRFQRQQGAALNDSDPRAAEVLAEMRATWDNAPTVQSLDGAAVRLAGYVVPLDEVRGELKSFLLVPYFGACIHTPPPAANQIVLVAASRAVKGFQAMDTVWVSGTLHARRSDSPFGASGYRLDAIMVQPYVAAAR